MVVCCFLEALLELSLCFYSLNYLVDRGGELFGAVKPPEEACGWAYFGFEGVTGFPGVVDIAEEGFNDFNLGFDGVEVDGLGRRWVEFPFDIGRALFACEDR